MSARRRHGWHGRRAARAVCALAALLAAAGACTGGGSSATRDSGAADTGAATLPESAAAVVTPPMAPDDAAAADTGAPPGAFVGTLEPTRRERRVAASTILTDVRTARHEGYERVVFELRGTEVPGYDVFYESGPVQQCGSGSPVQVAGEARLVVRLRSTHAHEFEGERVIVSVPDRDRDIDYPLLRQLTLICDFEGQVEWVLGLAEQQPYRVLELSSPTRLVVDVQSAATP